MLRAVIIVAALAAIIIAALVPNLRDLIAAAALGSFLSASAASFGARERAAARQAATLAIRVRSEIAHHL